MSRISSAAAVCSAIDGDALRVEGLERACAPRGAERVSAESVVAVNVHLFTVRLDTSHRSIKPRGPSGALHGLGMRSHAHSTQYSTYTRPA